MYLAEIKILVVGVGGLGCPAVTVLAEAGIGTLGLMDPDVVELSNLHRQMLYSPKDLGRKKTEAAFDHLSRRFPKTKYIPIPEAIASANASKTLSSYDLIIDGLDRLEKKFFLNDWCVNLGKPYVHAGVVKFEGQVMAVDPGKSACLRCLIPKLPPPFAMPTCQEAGVLGSFSQTIGYLQAHEALQFLKGERPLKLWKVDMQKSEWRSIVPKRNPSCQVCGQTKAEVEKMAEPSCRI